MPSRWFTFEKNFDWFHPGYGLASSTHFKALSTYQLNTPQAEAALAAGAARKATKQETEHARRRRTT